MYKNSEGYDDLTAGAAMSRMMKEYRKQQRKYYAYKNRRKIYVASKYAGDEEKNVKNAIGYCRRVIEQGHMPLASHLLYPQMLDDTNPEERKMGRMFGMALLGICDEVWVFGEISSGMAEEIREAKTMKKTLRYFGEENA